MSREQLYLYETTSCTQRAKAQATGLDVYFPPEIAGWTDVLDCREAPYTERSLEENCAYALHVRKRFILVSHSQIAQETPPTQAS
ncbi:MAG: hypothetical protein H0U74_11030 [Bradymonadaceae bacterium]|nr:hypothetical protein [Lujinxingiaceae bacterium]